MGSDANPAGHRPAQAVIGRRLLAAAGYGAYAYAMAWIALLNVLAILGMDTLLVRNIAAYRTQSA